VRTIDGDALGPEKMPVVVLAEFAELAAGEALLLTASSRPRDALTALQLQWPEEFDWIVLQDDPDRFRVEIRRSEHRAERTIQDVLSADHDRLDRAAAEVVDLMEGPAREAAAARLDELICGLERHFAQEENVLFVVIERVTGNANRHLDLLRREHVFIRGIMKSIRDAFAGKRPAEVATASASLRLELRRHARKELWVLYPLLDEIAGGTRKGLLRAMEET
jgi:uncharacterized protein (DUF2249 family)